MLYIFHKHKGQFFSYDIISAVVIFLIAILLITFYLWSLPATIGEEDIKSEAFSLSNSLLTPGNPINWNETNVLQIGLTDSWENHIINSTKLSFFSNMANEEYNKTKERMRIRHNYYIVFEDLKKGQNIISVGIEPGNAKNIWKIERIVIYEKQPVKMVVSLWSERA